MVNSLEKIFLNDWSRTLNHFLLFLKEIDTLLLICILDTLSILNCNKKWIELSILGIFLYKKKYGLTIKKKLPITEKEILLISS